MLEPVRRVLRPVNDGYAKVPGIVRAALLFGLLCLIPFTFSDPWVRVFFLVGLYVVLGLGLNVVVGYAGLLDLGYVAFFATGAYLLGITTSPSSPLDMGLNFWVVLPLSLLVGGIVGFFLGLPVLPLRGDYLAIVTLGFGEIIRIVLVNARDITNGSQGLSSIAKPSTPFGQVNDLHEWYFFILVVAFGTAFVTARLRDARIGRAWEAIREDEDAAAAMGINTVKYKLMAFGTGAAIGAFGGVIYASFITFINPSAFSLLVSINVLAIVIIGGMGSTPGIVFGALILIGAPEIMQFRDTANFLENFEFLSSWINNVIDGFNKVSPWELGNVPPASEWGVQLARKRFIIYGAMLVAVMVLRPSGLFPSRRRRREFEAPPEHEVAVGQV